MASRVPGRAEGRSCRYRPFQRTLHQSPKHYSAKNAYHRQQNRLSLRVVLGGLVDPEVLQSALGVNLLIWSGES